MKLGVIADDFTGASDIANTLARGGMATTQFLGVPRRGAQDSCEAGVVALKTRSIAAGDAVAQSMAALRWLQAQGCSQFVFKYCSTFDSTPEGNIGPVGEALAEALGAKGVVACPAFPGAGRTLYQGHLFVGDRPLDESPLRDHPLNPMSDADLRRWLRRQTMHDVGLVAHGIVRQGGAAIAKALADSAQRGEWLVIVDAIADADLMAIGAACRDARLVTGGSGIAMGLAANFRASGAPVPPKSRAVAGPCAILSGSCSTMTNRQVAVHRDRHPAMAVATDDVVAGRITPHDVLAFVRKSPDGLPLVYTTAAPEEVAAAQQRHGAAKVAHAIERFLADAAVLLVESGVRRLVVAGGETSGAVATALGMEALDVGPEIDPGVPILYGAGNEPFAITLKSGNFGAEDFFEKAARRMAG